MDCDYHDTCVNGEAEADSKPFSIRQFVADTRRKAIILCWPFPKKYLQICLKYGISNVLPPFEPCINPTTQATDENVGWSCSDQQHKDHVSFENKVVLQEKLIKDECNCYYDEMLSKAPCHESNLSFDYTSNVTVPVARDCRVIPVSVLIYVTRVCSVRLRVWFGIRTGMLDILRVSSFM
ncbi:hypothetical protein V6N13_060520 [Hibiscus sabdariffa]|uniref:Uncharacterized protein n=1 Tax=Hibiscus sabdariffa TaxID=183260 RepID=A0ABR2P8B8_9ROSI